MSTHSPGSHIPRCRCAHTEYTHRCAHPAHTLMCTNQPNASHAACTHLDTYRHRSKDIPTPSSHMQTGTFSPYTGTPVHTGPAYRHSCTPKYTVHIYGCTTDPYGPCICTPMHISHSHMCLHIPQIIEAHSVGHVASSVRSQTQAPVWLIVSCLCLSPEEGDICHVGPFSCPAQLLLSLPFSLSFSVLLYLFFLCLPASSFLFCVFLHLPPSFFLSL